VQSDEITLLFDLSELIVHVGIIGFAHFPQSTHAITANVMLVKHNANWTAFLGNAPFLE